MIVWALCCTDVVIEGGWQCAAIAWWSSFRCCTPRVSLSREEQAQPLNFPRLLNGFRLGLPWLAKRHGARWLAHGCAGMLDQDSAGLNDEWFWPAHTFPALSLEGCEKGAFQESPPLSTTPIGA